eukprot:4640591-Prymnesium_polylepis.1
MDAPWTSQLAAPRRRALAGEAGQAARGPAATPLHNATSPADVPQSLEHWSYGVMGLWSNLHSIGFSQRCEYVSGMTL